MEREKLLERIRKLYVMSQATDSSPHEAEIALRRCQSLMSRFGITEADLETSEFDVRKAASGFRVVPMHLRVLCSAVALLHDCLVVEVSGFMEFRGYSIDTEVAEMSLEFLAASMERSLKKAKASGEVPGGRSPSYDYRIGYAASVLQRCQAIDSERKQKQRDESSAQSLVLMKMAMVRAHCAQDLAPARKRVVRTRMNRAHEAGRRDGRVVSLQDEIN